MKKLTISTIIILFAVVVGILQIKNKALDTDITANTTRVGVIFPGECKDRSFSQTHYDALSAISKELNLQIICKEWVADDAGYDAIMELIQKDRCDIIIAASFGYGEDVVKIAQAYPTICFLHATGSAHLKNMSSYMGRMYQARYLSGIVAGKRTETGEIGYTAAFPIPEVVRGINAFTLGVKCVRPDAVVHVKYCGSWTEDEAAGQAFLDLADKYPIDVVTVHTDSLQPLFEADKRHIWIVGYNMDNSELFPDTYLTACEWHWKDYYHDQILSYLQGKFHGANEWIDMRDGVVGLSPLTKHVAPGTEPTVQWAQHKLNGRIFDVFYGPIVDNKGKLRVGEGESMSDDEMMNHFNWYVKGVKVED